jgi:HEAT repeat protein
VQRFLAALALPEEKRTPRIVDVLLETLGDAILGDDAVRALASRVDTEKKLSAEQQARVGAALTARGLPSSRRRALVDWVGAARLVSLSPQVRSLLADPDLAPYARRTLAALGEPVDREQVRADLSSPDAAVRAAALDAASGLPAPERLDALSDRALADPDPALRRQAVELLGRNGPVAVEALGRVLRKGDSQTGYYAAQELGAIGDKAALDVLGQQLQEGSYESQVATVFALRRCGSAEALRLLEEAHAKPSDPRLVRMIEAALGAPEKHE